jgi:DNA-binding response OmpR family regulator
MSSLMQRLQEPDRQPQPDTSKFHSPSCPDVKPAQGARRTVLWVSGDAGQAMDCAAFLQGIGFDVIPVKSVPMGAARLAELSAIVLDADSIGADIATGNLHRLRRLAPQVPVILMTSDAGESDFSSSEVGAPDATLCKPLSFHHLELGLQMVTDFG